MIEKIGPLKKGNKSALLIVKSVPKFKKKIQKLTTTCSDEVRKRLLKSFQEIPSLVHLLTN